ncbi:MAG: RHS repeat-associated core domain-containing protein [Chloroflexaceae bacterium]|nr:RHS repeat-associated core domain-containing protein [Chloroflexaceae bacterium]
MIEFAKSIEQSFLPLLLVPGSVYEVRLLLTDSTGAVTDRSEYDAFGVLQHSAPAPGTTYRYTRQQYDAATGLYSLRARWYDGGTGRFLTRDTYPIDFQNPVELNRYGYTANNPVNGTDPSGLSFVETGTANRENAEIAKARASYRAGYTPACGNQTVCLELLAAAITAYSSTKSLLRRSMLFYLAGQKSHSL